MSLRGIRNRIKREKQPRILILGLDNAGKTTILNKLSDVEDPAEDGARKQNAAKEGPTQGFNVKSMSLSGKKASLCDLGGQRALREYWKDYFDACDCLMFVVDSSDSRRLQEAHEAFKEVVEALPKAPILVFANKQDLANARPPDEIAELLELTEYRERKWQIQGCSARSGNGLEEGIMWIMNNA